MFDKETIIKTFIENFIIKDKKERCYFELTNPKKRNKFTDRLNHKWDTVLNMKHLTQIGKNSDFAGGIQNLLEFKDNELCYVISNYYAIDDQLISFKDIFGRTYACGLGTILINTTADTLFLDTEHTRGPAERFIGRITKKLYSAT
jgi:hypothetical protein